MKKYEFLPPPEVLHCQATPKQASLLTVAVIAALAAVSGNAFATTTINTDTTYSSGYDDSVSITSSGQLHGADQTDMSIAGTLSNSGKVSQGQSLSVGGKITNNTGAIIENIGTISGGEGLSNKGTIKGDRLITSGYTENLGGTIEIGQFGDADHAVEFYVGGGTIDVSNDSYVKSMRIGNVVDTETSVTFQRNLNVEVGFRLQDADASVSIGSFSGNGYVSAEAGTINVTGDVKIGQHVGARNGGSVIVQGAVTAANGIQAEAGGTVTVGSANVNRLYASGENSAITVTGVAQTDTVIVNTGSSLSVNSLTARTGDALTTFSNAGDVTITSSDLTAVSFENKGTINKDAAGVSHLDHLAVTSGAWITGDLDVKDFDIAGSLTVNENSTMNVDKLGTAEQAVQPVSVKQGASLNVSGDAFFGSGLGGGGDINVTGKANLVASYQEIRVNLDAESFSALGMTALYGALDVKEDLTLEDKATFIVDSDDLTIGQDLVLNGGAKVQMRNGSDGLVLDRVVLNTNENSYFQAYSKLQINEIEVNGYARIETYADGKNSSLDIGSITAADNSVVKMENAGTFNGFSSTAEIDSLTLGDGATFINSAATHGGVPTPPFEGLNIGAVDGTNAVIRNEDGGSTIIGTLTGSGNTIESVTADGTGVLITKNESDNLNYIVADGDSYGSTQEALEAGAGKIESSTSNYTVKTLDDLVNGEGSAIFDSNGNQIYSAAQESRTMTALKQFSNATLVQWRYETNHLSDRLGEVRSNLGTAGAWARVYGADTKVTDNVTTDVKTNTIQVGSDATVGNWIIGGAFSYTSMDGDISNGAADGETYSLAAYASGFFDCGGYLDVIGRIGRMSTDIKASSGTGKLFDGSYDNTAFGLSLEAGYHWDLSQTFFVEPQAELSYGYVLGDDFTTSTPNRVKVEQDDFQTLVGRIGARFGAAFPEKAGTFYVQASVNHEFLGDNDFDATPEGGTRRSFNSELDGTWISYGVGFQINATDALGVYGSLSRANGDDYQDDYRYSVGMRYVF